MMEVQARVTRIHRTVYDTGDNKLRILIIIAAPIVHYLAGKQDSVACEVFYKNLVGNVIV